MQAYRIRNWRENFETSESRRYKALSWVKMPNKHDGKGYARVAKHEHAVSLFCAWSLILQVASKMPERGLLVDEDGPLDADDIADQTRFPSGIFEQAFDVLSDPRIGWLELVEIGSDGSVTVVDPEHAKGTPGAHPGKTQGRNGAIEYPAPYQSCGNTQGTPRADPGHAPATPMIEYSTVQESTGEKSTEYLGHGEHDPKASGYPDSFEQLWRQYPKREGGDSKREAWQAWRARLTAGVSRGELEDGVKRYAKYIRDVGQEGTRFVKHAKTFLGPNEWWNQEWKVNQEAANGTGHDKARERRNRQRARGYQEDLDVPSV